MITQGLQENAPAQEGQSNSSAMSPMHFFLHIPKCGGTTFSDYLSRYFPRSQIYTADKSIAIFNNHQDLKAKGEIRQDKNFEILSRSYIESMKTFKLIVENHFPWIMMQALFRSRKMVLYTLLRDPRERVISHYMHLRRIAANPPQPHNSEEASLYKTILDLPIDEFFSKIEVKGRWGALFNLQTRFLSSYELCANSWNRIGEDKILEDVLKNLERIDFLADLKNLNEFAHLISLSNDWFPPGQLVSLNSGGHANRYSSDLLSQVPDSCISLDQVIYEAGLKKYAAWREKVLQEAAVRLWCSSSQSHKPALSSDEWVLDFDNVFPAENIYGREGKGEQTIRWLGPSLESRFYIPVRPNVTNWISVYVTAFMKPELYSTTRYFINGKDVSPVGSTDKKCTVLTFPVDSNQTGTGVVDLRIKTTDTFSDVTLNRGTDKREKSLAIRGVKASIYPPSHRNRHSRAA